MIGGMTEIFGYVRCSECDEMAVPMSFGYRNVEKDGYTFKVGSFISYGKCLNCGRDHEESS